MESRIAKIKTGADFAREFKKLRRAQKAGKPVKAKKIEVIKPVKGKRDE
jgi:hypothetical protein